MRDHLIGIIGHMRQGVQPYEIGCFKHAGSGSAHDRSEQGIRFRNADPFLEHQLHHLDHALHTDSIADKIRGILGPHNSFAQNPFPEVGHKIKNLAQGFFAGNNFKQFHVSDRIKKVGPQKVLLEFFAAPFGHRLQRDTGGVRRNDGAFFANRLNSL